ncbi:MAG: UvrD-helicase domain-containing protein [Phycisphaeraceae bacterium]|nr:UvrD-helicase domain-containing protein [Phycisphaeraceae bacterium]
MDAGMRDETRDEAMIPRPSPSEVSGSAALTPSQQRAVEHVDGPVLVLAGPGSGKTRVITRRIAHLVSIGIPAWQIMALTFTNKAASEMRRRVDSLIPADAPGRRGLVVSTFHSFASMLLRHHPEETGLRPGFVIHDTSDQRDTMKRVIADLGVGGRWTPASALAQVSRLKNALRSPADAAGDGDFRGRSVARLYEAYQAELARSNAVDFDDLLYMTARLLRSKEALRRAYSERFRYLLIDEYQDTNHAQLVIARAIAEHGNIMVVGDPDQSIYGWRGADLRNILEFEEAFPGAEIIPLGENFRSTGYIVDAASSLIRHNTRRRHKVLSTSLGPGRRPLIIGCFDEHHEAQELVGRLREAERSGMAWRDMAVLYRMNALSRVVEDALRRDGVPYQVVRGTAFFERREVKDALAYLRVLSNPADATSLRRIVNVPARGLGDVSLDRLDETARARDLSLSAMLLRASEAGVTGRALKAAGTLGALFERWRSLGRQADASALGELVRAVIDESGLRSHYTSREESDEDFEDEDRLANLDELENAAHEFVTNAYAEGDQLDASNAARAEDLERSWQGEADLVASMDGDSDLGDRREPPDAACDGDMADPTAAVDGPGPMQAPKRNALEALAAWLESVALVADSDALDGERGAVTLMTLHAAKGLEFPLVAMIGLEEGLLPHARSIESADGCEEERRLCFVGMTRAERTLLLLHSGTRIVHGVRHSTRESRFLGEIDAKQVERVDAMRSASSDVFDDLESGHQGSGGRPGWRGSGRGAEEQVFRVDRSEDWHGGKPSAPRRASPTSGGTAGARGATLQGFSVGSMVRHPLFGIGRVIELLPRAGASSVRVNFNSAGVKTLVLAYAKLQKLT